MLYQNGENYGDIEPTITDENDGDDDDDDDNDDDDDDDEKENNLVKIF